MINLMPIGETIKSDTEEIGRMISTESRNATTPIMVDISEIEVDLVIIEGI